MGCVFVSVLGEWKLGSDFFFFCEDEAKKCREEGLSGNNDELNM